jgi:hypothetical protein
MYDLGTVMQENYTINSEVFKNWHTPFHSILRTQNTIKLILKSLENDEHQRFFDLPM